MRPAVANIAHDLVERVATGTHELVEELAVQYPVEVFATLIGADPVVLADLGDDVSNIARLWGYDAGEWRSRIEASLERLGEFADGLRKEPQGVVARIEQLELDDDARRVLVMQLLVAGWETTSSQAASLLWALSSKVQRWEAMRSGEYPARALAEECMRWQPAASGAMRFSHADTELGDIEVTKGTREFGSFMWASRDPAVYDDAESWVPGRFAAAEPPPAPLAFGGGRHRCLGMPLALVELDELVNALIDVGPEHGWEIASPIEWTNHRRPRRPVSLPAQPRR
jgi:cytochrome P450